MSTPLGATQDRKLAVLRISIAHIPDRPWLGRLRADVEAAVEETGTTPLLEEVEGPFVSPTLLINGVALNGYPLDAKVACRIDLPTRDEIASAIAAARAGRTSTNSRGEDQA